MDRLAIYLAVLGGSSITGALVIAAFSMGYYSWEVILGCVVAGLVMAWPSGKIVSRRIKRQDPEWDTSHKERDRGIIPKPNAPEV